MGGGNGSENRKIPSLQPGSWVPYFRIPSVRAQLRRTFTQTSFDATYRRESTNMQQRVQIFHRRDTPSSATQLPIMTALHAENLTLFVLYLTGRKRKCKVFFISFLVFLYQLYNRNSFGSSISCFSGMPRQELGVTYKFQVIGLLAQPNWKFKM